MNKKNFASNKQIINNIIKNNIINKNKLTKDEEHLYYLGIPENKIINYNCIKDNINKIIIELKEDIEFSIKNDNSKFPYFIEQLNESIIFYENLINNIEKNLSTLQEKNKIIKIYNNYKRI